MSSGECLEVRKRRFGATDAEISEIGFGAGGYWSNPALDASTRASLLWAAVGCGVNWIDTGPTYSGGDAERHLGELLGARRDDLFLATKVGTKLTDGGFVTDFTPGAMRESLQGSLERLRTDRVDLLSMHSPTLDHVTNEDTLGALAAFKSEGSVRFLGLSPAHRYGLDVARAAIASGVFDGLMLTYNVTSPPATEEVIGQAARAGIAVLAKLPLGRAIFDRSWRRVRSRADLWYVLRGLRTMRRAVLGSRKYGFLNEVEGSTAAQVALRYVLDNPNVTSAVPGTVKLQHLRQNIAVSQSPPLSGELTERIRRAAA